MFYPLLEIFVEYSGAVVVGILVGLIFKAWFARQMHNKIRGYQEEIAKSHSKILSLEAENDSMAKRIKELESKFTRRRQDFYELNQALQS